MSDHIRRFFADDGAATAIQYGLIAALVSVVAVHVLTSSRISLISIFDFVSVQIDVDPDQCRDTSCAALPKEDG